MSRTSLGLILLGLLISGCDCGSSDTPSLPDAGFADARVDAAIPGRDGSTCDMATGAGCPCSTEGETRGCSTGGVGACGMGTQRCEGGLEFPAWSACGDVPEASAETCNGIDDDCDAATDE